MQYLLIIHFLINSIILYWYIDYKKEMIKGKWKEVITIILIGWIIILFDNDY